LRYNLKVYIRLETDCLESKRFVIILKHPLKC